MARYRALQTNFWDDGFVMDLTPEEKYFFIYLITNSRTTQCGCYELPYRFAEMQTGYNRETIEKLISRFIEYGKIKYNLKTKEILILNWSKHNYTGSPKVMNCILKEIEDIKCTDFKAELYKICIEYGYPIDTLYIDLGEKEKEKEKEKEHVGRSVIKEFSQIYQNNIGVINSITATWLIELTEIIDVGLFNRAVEICTEKGKLNQGYLKGIIKNWTDSNITTFEQYKAHELQEKNDGTSKTKNGKDVEPSEITGDQEQEARELLRELGIQVQ